MTPSKTSDGSSVREGLTARSLVHATRAFHFFFLLRFHFGRSGRGPSDEVPWMGRNSNRCNAVIVYGNVCISFGLDGVVLVSSRTRTLQDAAHSYHMGMAREDGRLRKHAYLTEAKQLPH